MTPDMLRMIDEVHDVPDPDLAAVQAVFRRHDCDIVVED
jgi:hypothetical protein